MADPGDIMPAPEANTAGAVDMNGDYSDDSVTVAFALDFNACKAVLWWALFLVAVAFAFSRRHVVSRAWFVYVMLLGVIFFNGAQTVCYVAYALQLQNDHSGTIPYILYLGWFNIARSSFLAVLLVVASGYCITRADLGPHKQHVVAVPATVLVTGLITDYSFFALQSSPDASTYDLTSMSTVAATVWFVCSVLNLAAMIMAWLYLFEALGKEVAALEEEHKARTGKLEAEQRAAAEAEAAAATAAAVGPGGYAPLQAGGPGVPGGGGGGGGHGAVPVFTPPSAAADPEAPPPAGEGESVADHLAYTSKRALLSRFSAGVAAYLVADIAVLLLPAFFNHVVQSTLQVLLFVCYAIFIVALLVLFRPQEASTYLMVGFSEDDAEARGVNDLTTSIGLVELGGGGRSGGGAGRRSGEAAEEGGERARLARGGGGGGASSSSASSAALAGGRGGKPPSGRKAGRKGEAGAERYLALPGGGGVAGGGGGGALPLPPPPSGGGGALPVSTLQLHPGGQPPPPPSYAAAASLPAAPRAPRTFVPRQPTPGSNAFTLDGEDDKL